MYLYYLRHAFCSSFLLVLKKGVAEMHNLSSTVNRDAIRKYISRIAVCCVSCVIALVFCKRFFFKYCVFPTTVHFSLNILCMSLYHMQWTGHATSLCTEKLYINGFSHCHCFGSSEMLISVKFSTEAEFLDVIGTKVLEELCREGFLFLPCNN